VHDPGVDFLDAGSLIVGDDPFEIGAAFEFAAIAAEESDGEDFFSFGGFLGGEEVGGFAAGGEEDEKVLGSAEGLKLAGEDLLVAKVVGDAGESGGVGGEADGGERSAVAFVAAEEFLGHVHGIGGAAAIAGGDDFSASAEGGDDFFSHLGDEGHGFFARFEQRPEFAIVRFHD